MLRVFLVGAMHLCIPFWKDLLKPIQRLSCVNLSIIFLLDKCFWNIGTSHIIWDANKLTGFYITGTMALVSQIFQKTFYFKTISLKEISLDFFLMVNSRIIVFANISKYECLSFCQRKQVKQRKYATVERYSSQDGLA